MIPKYYRAEISTSDKCWPIVVKHFPGNRHCTTIYFKDDNDCFLRREVMSHLYIEYGKEIEKEVYEHLLNKVLKVL